MISDIELDVVHSDVVILNNPNAGKKMVAGALLSQNLRIQRNKTRNSIHNTPVSQNTKEKNFPTMLNKRNTMTADFSCTNKMESSGVNFVLTLCVISLD